MPTLSTLSISQLVFAGIHGSTGKEPTDPQYFEVDIDIHLDVTKAAITDTLIDTYDYKIARDIAQKIIEQEHYVLIETIAMRIAQAICCDTKVYSVDVAIKKLNSAQQGIPGISVSHKRAPQEM
jgi:7,8-dihydroneopterin aldolase/epimerase/oxygenase